MRAWVRAQDWEDNVDTKVYMKLLTGLRKAFDAATPSKKYLITVAPGWPRYPWDASANGVVDAFDMMSYSNSLQVRKRVLLRHLNYIKTIILPRQARDKHGKAQKKCRFLIGPHESRQTFHRDVQDPQDVTAWSGATDRVAFKSK